MPIDYDILDKRILPHVSTPAQYIGGELNQIVKAPDSVRIRWALAYPDTYAVGMGHQGLKILYDILNRIDDVAAERVFCPWIDMERELRRHGMPLYSLETFTPLSAFDLVGFSISYELCYTNILTMLDLAGIPLRASERSDSDPLIVGGGQCVYSAEPIADFFDFFVNGEGEDVVVEITNVIREAKDASLSRAAVLEKLAKTVPGVYVPSLYTVDYHADGRIAAIAPTSSRVPARVARRYVRDLDAAPFPVAPVVPWVETVQDRYTIEIMRGCVNGCRFCQSGMITRPRRQRSVQTVVRLVERAALNTGYEEVGLLSLSSSDYIGIQELAETLIEKLAPIGMNVSLPSLRVRTVVDDLAKVIATVRKSGMTLAPEAASEKLRRIINKPIRDEELFENVRQAYRNGYRKIKLYFMVGLPGETDDDVRAIVHLSERIAELRRDIGGGPARVTVTVSHFVPKPGTPFQWEPQISREDMLRYRDLILREKRLRSVRYNFHDAGQSVLEGVLARGDRRLSVVVESAWRAGARFDSWTDTWNPDRWTDAFAEHGIDPDFYTSRVRADDDMLPWAHLATGVTGTFLRLERDRSRLETASLTPGCGDFSVQDGRCVVCGACERSPDFNPEDNVG